MHMCSCTCLYITYRHDLRAGSRRVSDGAGRASVEKLMQQKFAAARQKGTGTALDHRRHRYMYLHDTYRHGVPVHLYRGSS